MEQDSSITIAFDDVPEECLNNPLRLEKLANEVHNSWSGTGHVCYLGMKYIWKLKELNEPRHNLDITNKNI